MFYSEIIAVCSENLATHKIHYGQYHKLFTFKLALYKTITGL